MSTNVNGIDGWSIQAWRPLLAGGWEYCRLLGHTDESGGLLTARVESDILEQVAPIAHGAEFVQMNDSACQHFR